MHSILLLLSGQSLKITSENSLWLCLIESESISITARSKLSADLALIQPVKRDFVISLNIFQDHRSWFHQRSVVLHFLYLTVGYGSGHRTFRARAIQAHWIPRPVCGNNSLGWISSGFLVSHHLDRQIYPRQVSFQIQRCRVPQRSWRRRIPCRDSWKTSKTAQCWLIGRLAIRKQSSLKTAHCDTSVYHPTQFSCMSIFCFFFYSFLDWHPDDLPIKV